MARIIQIVSKLLSIFLLTIFLLHANQSILAQTNAPSIQSGVTFQYSDTQSSNTDPATIESITVNGTVYNLFTAPSGYQMTQLGHQGNSINHIRKNGNLLVSTSASSIWSDTALAAFQNKNLNYYFEANGNGRNICNQFTSIAGTDAQKQSLLYSPSIPANDGGIIAITERNANNCFHIAIYGTPPSGGAEQLLGETFVNTDGVTYWGSTVAPPASGSDYWLSGRVLEGGNSIGIAIFNLSDVVQTGSQISRVQLTAASFDHGDGKFFILQTYAVDDDENVDMNIPINGDASTSDNAPANSTYSIVSGPVHGTISINTDGTYLYTPDNNYEGKDSFTYELCLPAPNTTTCDQAVVTFDIVNSPPDAINDINQTLQDSAVSGNVLLNDKDPNGELLNVTPTSGTTANGGVYSINTDGAYTYTPASGFTGTDTFTYQACDNGSPSLCDIATVTINVIPCLNEPDFPGRIKKTP